MIERPLSEHHEWPILRLEEDEILFDAEIKLIFKDGDTRHFSCNEDPITSFECLHAAMAAVFLTGISAGIEAAIDQLSFKKSE